MPIATDLVLTAAHCLCGRQTGAPEDIGQIRFRAGLHEGEAVAEAAAVRAVAHRGYDPRERTGKHSIRLDLALAPLSGGGGRPLCGPHAGKLGQGQRLVLCPGA